jgi:hypothetical protein
MQTSPLPASLLTQAFSTEMKAVTNENKLYSVKKNSEYPKTESYLHGLFFGKLQTAGITTLNEEEKTDEPDYYSSYE